MSSTTEMRLPFSSQRSLCQHFYPAFLDFCVFAVPARTQQDRTPLRRHNDTTLPYSEAPITSCVCSLPARAENNTADISRLSSFGGPTYPPDYIAQLFADEAPGDFCGEPMWAVIPQISENPVVKSTRIVNAQEFLETQSIAYTHVEPQQCRLSPEVPDQPLRQHCSHTRRQTAGIFNQAHHFSVTGTFIDSNVIHHNNNVASDEFMEKLLRETIPGAAYDSSARDPPPRCHPGTRLVVLQRCIYFIRTCNGVKKMRWVVGAAGVGKSAVMQSVAESPELQLNCHASVFFSISGRNDGTKAIQTITYQLAARSDSYRQVIEREITRDPSLLQSSMARQFEKFIIQPFTHDPELKSPGRALIILDGLDECDSPRTQQELLRLISDFCVSYPCSPLVWLIASRPESHITAFFSRAEVIPVYEKEEIHIDSDEARSDVECFLRHELNEIKQGSDSLDPQWPDERDIWKLASAAGGLFAYAQTAIRYIGDWRIGNPVSQLSDVIHVIDEHPMAHLPRGEHPMALLDALYDRILSKVPSRIMVNTRKLLLALVSHWDFNLVSGGNFIVLCNWLGMTPDEIYAALNHLRAVLYVPRRDEATKAHLIPFHKSFVDYVSDFTRSGFSRDIQGDAQQLMAQCAFRILQEAPGGIHQSSNGGLGCRYGVLSTSSRIGDKLSLTWSVDEHSDIATRLRVYQLAVGVVVNQIKSGVLMFQSEFCIRLLTARFRTYNDHLPHDELRDWVFDEPRRSDLIMNSVLKQVPLGAVDFCKIDLGTQVKVWSRALGKAATDSPDPWSSSCKHERKGREAEGEPWEWMSTFIPHECSFCCNRLERQLRSWKMHSPHRTVPILFTSTSRHCVEVRYIEPEDEVSEWRYRFWFNLWF